MQETIGMTEIKTIPLLDDRQSLECLLAIEYADRFCHGTDGHSRLVLIARLVRLLVTLIRQNKELDNANKLLVQSRQHRFEGERE